MEEESSAEDVATPEPDLSGITSREERYFQLLVSALQVSANYLPRLGQDAGVSLAQFQTLYSADPFYQWVGIDSPLMYAAHKAAGGMTSIYRQLGIGGERVFRAVLQDTLGLSREQATWSYTIPRPASKPKVLTLDGRIALEHIADGAKRQHIQEWMTHVQNHLQLPDDKTYKGMVFEVRQGYKSMDSKRQNADIDNAINAHINDYIPIMVLLSTQINAQLLSRYVTNRLLLLTGTQTGAATASTYAFCREVIGYDLAAFFENHSPRIRMELEKILQTLLEVH